MYDETLQAKALLSGTICITLKADTSFHRTVGLSPALLSLGNYDSTTQILTIDPGAPIHLRYVWDFIDDSSRDVRQAVFVYATDPSCALRKISSDVTLTIAGNLKVFDHTGVIPLGPIDVTFRHVSPFVDGRLCPTIETDGPCGLTQ